jgi:D-alanine-D-alanine ligase
MKKLHVGVFMGGRSLENEVSFVSGRTVCDHLDTTKYNAIPIFQRFNGQLYILPLRFLHRGKISDFDHRLEKEAQKIEWEDLKKMLDFVYVAGHGRFMEDGCLQGMLEVLQLPYLASKVLASALGMDKIMQRHFLNAAGILTPLHAVISADEAINFKEKQDIIIKKIESAGLKFPIFVKPFKEGSSLGISVVIHKNELENALKNAALVTPGRSQDVVLEEKIVGMEFTCIILTDPLTQEPMPLPPTEIISEEGRALFDYEQKYMPGRAHKFTPARCSQQQTELIQKTCIQTMKALDMKNLARIDGFLTRDNKIYIIDPNTISGMGPSFFLFRQAAEINMSHTRLINHLIETELHAYGLINPTLESNQTKNETAMNKKIKVAVLLGGRTNEKEISLESGRNIIYKLSPDKYEVFPIFVNKDLNLYQITQRLLVANSTREIEDGITSEMMISWTQLSQMADFVFIGLHGGEGENGCIQGTLEMLNIPYNGSSVLASALCMDKYKSTHYLRQRGFDVPRSVLVTKNEWITDQSATLEKISSTISAYPLIIKPHDDGCSVMVQKARDKQQLNTAIESVLKEKNHVLIEECITGMELTVGCIGNSKPYALPPSEAVVTSDILSIEEKFLPGAGENQTPARLPKTALLFVQKTIEEMYAALGCKGYCRIDCFYQSSEISPTGKERLVFIEANTLPGMTPATCIFHQAAEIGIRPMDFIDIIVELGFQEHRTSKKTTTGRAIKTLETILKEKQATT